VSVDNFAQVNARGKTFFSYGLADFDGLILMILMGGVGILSIYACRGFASLMRLSQILQGFGPKTIFSFELARPRRRRPTHSGLIFRLLLNIAVGLPRSCDSRNFCRASALRYFYLCFLASKTKRKNNWSKTFSIVAAS